MAKSKTASKTVPAVVTTVETTNTLTKAAKKQKRANAPFKIPQGVKLIKLTNGNNPVGYVAFSRSTDGKIEATIAAQSPKDKWNHKLGHKIAVGRFSKPKNRILLEPKTSTSTFEEVRRAVLECIANIPNSDTRVCVTARKAAAQMLHDLNGDSVRAELTQFLQAGGTKTQGHKVKLIQGILDELLKKGDAATETPSA